jgi:exosortase
MTVQRRTVLFAVYSVCLVASQLEVLRALVNLARLDQSASHVVLIPFVTLVLIFQRRDSIFASLESAPLPGIGVIAVGLGVLLAGRLAHASGSHGSTLSVMTAGLVVLWVGGFLLFYGWKAFRSALFPLLFLGFTVPVPSVLLDPAILFLKTGSREAVSALFMLTGTPYHREGFIFSLPKFAIEIADECSGIRSSIALLLTGLMVGHLFLKTWWKKALLVAAILPMAMLKNGVRIVCLSLLASYVDPRFLTGQLHHDGGVVFFLLSMALLAPLFVLLANSERALAETVQPGHAGLGDSSA